MEGFTYHSLFETKGIEYLIIIGFFAILIPFWLLLKKKKASPFMQTAGLFSRNLFSIPGGVHFNRNHTWMFLEKNGLAKLGIDNLITRLTGQTDIKYHVEINSQIKKGDLLAEICQNGKSLKIYSPISGEISRLNQQTAFNSSASEGTYDDNWLVAISPSRWIAETQGSMLADQAVLWLQNEWIRIRDFLLDPQLIGDGKNWQPAMQDGGEIAPESLAHMPDSVWIRFQEEFL